VISILPESKSTLNQTKTWMQPLRTRFMSVLLLQLFLLFGGQSTFATESRTGKSWIPLAGWAKENNLKLTWTKESELFALTNE